MLQRRAVRPGSFYASEFPRKPLLRRSVNSRRQVQGGLPLVFTNLREEEAFFFSETEGLPYARRRLSGSCQSTPGGGKHYQHDDEDCHYLPYHDNGFHSAPPGAKTTPGAPERKFSTQTTMVAHKLHLLSLHNPMATKRPAMPRRYPE